MRPRQGLYVSLYFTQETKGHKHLALGAVVDVEGRPVRVAVRLTQRVDTRAYAVLLRGYALDPRSV